jgi:hypothetical protein
VSKTYNIISLKLNFFLPLLLGYFRFADGLSVTAVSLPAGLSVTAVSLPAGLSVTAVSLPACYYPHITDMFLV